MAKFSHHVFVCCNQRSAGHPRGCCDPEGAERLREALKSEVKRRGLGPEVRVNRAGCLDQCELGPTLVIYPQAIWYGRVGLEDVSRIVEETLIGGRIVADLQISDADLNNQPRHARTDSSSQPTGEADRA